MYLSKPTAAYTMQQYHSRATHAAPGMLGGPRQWRWHCALAFCLHFRSGLFPRTPSLRHYVSFFMTSIIQLYIHILYIYFLCTFPVYVLDNMESPRPLTIAHQKENRGGGCCMHSLCPTYHKPPTSFPPIHPRHSMAPFVASPPHNQERESSGNPNNQWDNQIPSPATISRNDSKASSTHSVSTRHLKPVKG